MPDGSTVAKAKVFGTLRRTDVYVWPDGTPAPTLLVTASRAPERHRRANTWTLTLDDGQTVEMYQGCGGCNPGRLRRWEPSPGAVRTDVTAG